MPDLISPSNKWKIPILVFLVTTVGVFPLDIYLPSMPHMANVFDVSVHQIASTISYFMAVFACAQLLTGPLSDMFGRKRILLFGLLLGGLATVAITLTQDFKALVFLRIIQALGLSSFVVTQAILRDVYEGHLAIKFQIFIAVLSGFLIAIAPLVGSFLQTLMGWRGSFILCAIMILITWFYTFFFYLETNQNLSKNTLNPPYLFQEYFGLLRNNYFFKHSVIATLGFSVHLTFVIISPFLFFKLLNVSIYSFGLLMLIYGGFYFVAGIIATRLIKKIQTQLIIKIGGFLILTGGLIMTILYLYLPISIMTVLVPMILTTIGITLARPAALSQALVMLANKAGFGSAGLGMMQYAGAGILSYSVNSITHLVQLPLAILAIVCGILILGLANAPLFSNNFK